MLAYRLFVPKYLVQSHRLSRSQLLTLVRSGYKVEGIVIEQRKNQRFDLRFPVQIVTAATNAKTRGETKNMSSSGVLVTCIPPVPVGEAIEYVITFPKPPGTRSEVRLRCVGNVVREDSGSTFATTLERYEFIRHPVYAALPSTTAIEQTGESVKDSLAARKTGASLTGSPACSKALIRG